MSTDLKSDQSSDSSYISLDGIKTQSVPWRLWEKAKILFWNPADIDFSQDRADWQSLTDRERNFVLHLGAGFMIGEERVTLEILPMLQAVANEQRLEDTVYLTSFALEEAKHVDFFARWFSAVEIDLSPYKEDFAAEYDTNLLFTTELTRVMRRLADDPCPEAYLDASLVYNQAIEGCIAMVGYHIWHKIFTTNNILPGLREGITHIQRDERRHMAYGTYVARRAVAEDPSLWEFAQRRMGELQAMMLAGLDPKGGSLAGQLFADPPFGIDPTTEVLDYIMKRVPRRLEVIEVAKDNDVASVETGTIEEDLEAELEHA